MRARTSLLTRRMALAAATAFGALALFAGVSIASAPSHAHDQADAGWFGVNIATVATR